MQSGLHIKYSFSTRNDGINSNHTGTASKKYCKHAWYPALQVGKLPNLPCTMRFASPIIFLFAALSVKIYLIWYPGSSSPPWTQLGILIPNSNNIRMCLRGGEYIVIGRSSSHLAATTQRKAICTKLDCAHAKKSILF